MPMKFSEMPPLVGPDALSPPVPGLADDGELARWQKQIDTLTTTIKTIARTTTTTRTTRTTTNSPSECPFPNSPH